MTLHVWVGDGRLDSRPVDPNTARRFTIQQGRHGHTGETGAECLMRARLSALWVRNVIGTIVIGGGHRCAHLHRASASQWAKYRHTIVPEAVVPAGQSGDGGWAHLEDRRDPASESESGRYGPKLPPDTVLTVITVDRAGSLPTRRICNGVITDGQRRWKNEGIGGFQPPATDGVTSLCSQPGCFSSRSCCRTMRCRRRWTSSSSTAGSRCGCCCSFASFCTCSRQ